MDNTDRHNNHDNNLNPNGHAVFGLLTWNHQIAPARRPPPVTEAELNPVFRENSVNNTANKENNKLDR